VPESLCTVPNIRESKTCKVRFFARLGEQTFDYSITAFCVWIFDHLIKIDFIIDN